MLVGVLTETAPGERRVAVVPDAVPRLLAAGLEVGVQSGAGRSAYWSDEAFAAAGAGLVDDAASLLRDADVILKVAPLSPAEVALMRPGSAVLGFFASPDRSDLVRSLTERRVTAFALELVPRITRAQAMDALSSQAVVSGYRAVLIAAERLPRFFPMFITAAGTAPPAKVLVLGAGVAGLQAISTARRLGAVVEAYDVRAAAKEEVSSLGATFVELDLESQEGTGGYAGEQTEDFLRQQRDLIGRHVAASDAVITTAAIPGRRAPVLVTEPMVLAMRPGSVVVDLAAESGGNCELSVAGEDVVRDGVVVHGVRNLPSSMPVHASQLLSRNLTTLLLLLVTDGRLEPDFDDPIVAGTCVTRDGTITHALSD